jgi:hypothetical protein
MSDIDTLYDHLIEQQFTTSPKTMDYSQIVTNTYQAKLSEIMKKIETTAFITPDIYSEYCFLLTELTNFISTDRFTIERTKIKQLTAEIEYGQEIKANWTSDKAITEAHINRCIEEQFIKEREANKIQDEYVKMLETMAKSYRDYSFAMKYELDTQNTQ